MAVVFSFDLSWLSPLLIFAGVVMFISRQDHHRRPRRPRADRPGADHAGAAADRRATTPLTAVARGAQGAAGLALPNEVLLDIVVGAVLAVLSYSSLAIVLLTATLASRGVIPGDVALGLVLGANLGSGCWPC
jgi:phosphate:Na+ symporter